MPRRTPAPSDPTTEELPQPRLRATGRILLGLFVLVAGIGHLTFARRGFQGQVPEWVPLDEDFVVVASGYVEIVLGSALLFARRRRPLVGWVVAAFLVAVFPGNISQLVERDDSLGLDSDTARWVRLPFQPIMIALALWSTGALRALRRRR